MCGLMVGVVKNDFARKHAEFGGLNLFEVRSAGQHRQHSPHALTRI